MIGSFRRYDTNCPGWTHKPRWWRKLFHRENADRKLNGLKPIDKPKCQIKYHTAGVQK
jgi:ABC-type antimicrobial peptide transport system ATPase subunit